MWKKLLAENEKVYHTLALFIYSLVIASVSPWCPQILYLRIQPITGQRYSWGRSAFIHRRQEQMIQDGDVAQILWFFQT